MHGPLLAREHREILVDGKAHTLLAQGEDLMFDLSIALRMDRPSWARRRMSSTMTIALSIKSPRDTMSPVTEIW